MEEWKMSEIYDLDLGKPRIWEYTAEWGGHSVKCGYVNARDMAEAEKIVKGMTHQNAAVQIRFSGWNRNP